MSITLPRAAAVAPAWCWLTLHAMGARDQRVRRSAGACPAQRRRGATGQWATPWCCRVPTARAWRKKTVAADYTLRRPLTRPCDKPCPISTCVRSLPAPAHPHRAQLAGAGCRRFDRSRRLLQNPRCFAC